MGMIDWKAFTVILDLVLKATWIKAKVNAREALFALILADLALDPDQRLTIDWRRNYGVQVVMAWMLAGWPDRLLQTLDLLNAPTIEEAASEVRVSTNMIERWLEIGMAYGLPAVTAKALRICDLTPDQKAEIAAWLREADRTHSGPTGWTREHARSGITARFGLLITTNTAYRFLLDNRPRPKRL